MVAFQPLPPLPLFKSHQDKVLANQQGALDQHTVCGQELDHLLLAHAGQLVLQGHGLIEQAAGVEKFLQGEAAALMPCGQLLGSRVVQLDVPEVIGDLVVIQPLFGLLAGGALGVTEKDHEFRPPKANFDDTPIISAPPAKGNMALRPLRIPGQTATMTEKTTGGGTQMVRDICKNEGFLAQKAQAATLDDLDTARDLLDTLIAHKAGCVGILI